ncbi:K(+)/H(+) antiporter [Mortierella alpina]|uniref:K(+)/H(+) antiporter n=1 Tax=Mortierella alpina TaxID=64518 RepID=A0A9P6M286_MORAP|nr:K(+)/H(+) antiporter [Mortierella alpina]
MGSVVTGLNPTHVNPGNPFPLFVIQAVIIVGLCYLLHFGLRKLKQPRVISEVIAGIILGPSVMGRIPGFADTIFNPAGLPYLNLISTVGLVMFLFLVGLELDPALVVKRAKFSLGITFAGMALPLGVGAAVSYVLYGELDPGQEVGFGQFLLFCGVAMSITAFPVLARILAEQKLLTTKVGFLTICAGAFGDIVAWILLALVVSIINSASKITPLYVVLLSVAWILILVFVFRPLFTLMIRVTKSHDEPSQTMMAFTLAITLISAFVTDIIGVHAIFGSFLVGLIIPNDTGFADGVTKRIEDLVSVIFLPIYFALSGLKTQVGLLDNGRIWGLVILTTFVACFGKIVGCSVAARVQGMEWRESFAIGVLMNCKGLIELIVLNIGYDAGVINDKVFVIMVAINSSLTVPASGIPAASSSTTEPAPSGPKLLALRLLHLSDRSSSVLLAATERVEVLRRDALMTVFQAFAKLNGIFIQPRMTLSTDPDDFAHSICDEAVDSGAGVVIMVSRLLSTTANTGLVTAVFVDRVFGGAGHFLNIMIPLYGSVDDEEALKLGSAMSHNRLCNILIVRIESAMKNNKDAGNNANEDEVRFQMDNLSISSSNDGVPEFPEDNQVLVQTYFPHRAFSQGDKRVNSKRTTAAGSVEAGLGVFVHVVPTTQDAIGLSKAILGTRDLLVMGRGATTSLKGGRHSAAASTHMPDHPTQAPLSAHSTSTGLQGSSKNPGLHLQNLPAGFSASAASTPMHVIDNPLGPNEAGASGGLKPRQQLRPQPSSRDLHHSHMTVSTILGVAAQSYLTSGVASCLLVVQSASKRTSNTTGLEFSRTPSTVPPGTPLTGVDTPHRHGHGHGRPLGFENEHVSAYPGSGQQQHLRVVSDDEKRA